MSNEPGINLKLIDIKLVVVSAWEDVFYTVFPTVEILHGDAVAELKRDECVVSPANSFGLMDGGFDLALARRFPAVQELVQERIVSEYGGEQPVGTSFIVEIPGQRYRVAHSPTMRGPSDVSMTNNAYTALSATLRAVKAFNAETTPKLRVDDQSIRIEQELVHAENPITTVVCTGLCTLTGMMDPRVAAEQMALAWKVFNEPAKHISWEYARSRQWELDRIFDGKVRANVSN